MDRWTKMNGPMDGRMDQNEADGRTPAPRRLAILAGLDIGSFARCFQSGRHAVEIHRVSKLARWGAGECKAERNSF